MKDAFDCNTVPGAEHHEDSLSKIWLQAVLDNTLMSIMALEAIRDAENKIIDFKYLFINKKAEESVKRKRLTGKCFLREFPGAIKSGLFDHCVQVTETGVLWEDEIFYNDDDYEFWSSVNVTKVNDGCLVMYSDMTDKKRKEQDIIRERNELSEREEQFKALMDHYPSLVFLKDEWGRYVFINATYEQQYVKSTDWYGKIDFDFWPKESAELFRLNDAEVLRSGQAHQFLEDAKDLNGARHCWLCYKFSFTDSKNRRYIGGIGLDVTDRVLAEEALKYSEEKFRSMFESSPIDMALLDLDGNYIDLNQAALELHGFTSKDELIGKSCFSLIDKDYHEKLAQKFEETYRYGPIQNIELVQLKKNGQKINTLVNATPLKDVNGKIYAVLAMVLDITLRKKTEQHLKDFNLQLEHQVAERTHDLAENKNLLQAIFDTLPRAFSVFESVRDENNKLVNLRYVLRNRYKIEGDVVDGLQGQLHTEMYPGTIPSGIHEKLMQVVETGKNADIEVFYPYEGMNAWLRIIAIKLNDGVVAFTEDITERKNAEQEIKDQAYFIQQITDTTPDVLIVYDLIEEKILYVNRGIFQTTDQHCYKIERLEKEYLKNYLHPNDYKKRIAQLTEAVTLKPGEVREMELRGRDANGKWHWFRVRDTFFKANEDGTTKQILSINQDITDQKEAEAAYLEEKAINMELKRMNEVMDTFVYAAAHDLKAPVSNMKLLTDVINSTDNKELKIQLQEKYSPIITTLDKTIAGLVSVVVIEKESGTISKELRFQDVFNTVVGELNGKIQEAGPDMVMDFSSCPSVVYIESYLICIFRNLLTNALKYRSQERRLIVNVQSRCTEKYILLIFSDNGIGIDLEKFGNDMFKPFKRFTSKSEGSGIGLHLIKSIVTKNGGKIEVESDVNSGTTFKIYLASYSKKV